MWVNQGEFAKLLQDNEARIYWQSDTLPGCLFVHVWTLEETGAVILREYQHESGRVLYWVADDFTG